MDEEAIRAAIRRNLGERWPRTRTGVLKEVGPSDRGPCSACGQEIVDEYDVRIVYAGGPTLRLHLECERMWRAKLEDSAR